MASIPDVQSNAPPSNDKTENPISNEPQTSTESSQNQTPQEPSTLKDIQNEIQTEQSHQDEHDNSSGVKACDDTRYRKYFKMLQFGVPAQAVKLKIANEGLDPNVLE